MMAKKPSPLASVFDDEPEPAALPDPTPSPARAATAKLDSRVTAGRKSIASDGSSRNHGTKKPVLIHIPEDMHRKLRQISVEEGEPLTAITERMLRQYLVAKGHTKFALPNPA